MTDHPESNSEDMEEVEGVATDEEQPVEDENLQKLREVPVGTNDPNIVGDVGPFDVPPGRDPHKEGEL